MRALLATLGLVAGALALVAAVVFGAGDARTFVSPPEAVAEDFVHALEMERYPQACKYLSSAARARIGPRDLEQATARLESRIGPIEDVRGEEGWTAGDDAEALAVVRTRETESATLRLRLRRERGVWRVMGIEGLAP